MDDTGSGNFPLDAAAARHDGRGTMSEDPNRTVSLDFTDEEFVRLHSAASAEGLEVNDFIVSTLRKHAKIVTDIESQQDARESDMLPEI